ncbi:N-acyl homoserine lactonase family protein [Azospirillum halopraeferens]|uniref:N-acyl homoserine lactonase family protein n=1 Tax=Azospirillum halopraeferens TaxID=34010 RepID=UPI000427FE8D|nr:N-acyl homoserine lactonase family protein [Azospirillum halopraeferens]
MGLPEYEVYALRYGVMDRRVADNFLNRAAVDGHDGPMPLDFFLWAIVGDGRTVVVDTGFGDLVAERRARRMIRHPVAMLEALGIDAAVVPDVIITHLHYDHAGNLDRFPAATFHIQDAEMAFATGRCMCHGVLRHTFEVEDVVQMVRHVYAGRVRFHDGDAELAPGITLHRIGGHTAGLQSVRVHTARGWVVLASDAAHYYANLDGNPFPLVHDVAAMLEGHRRLKEMAPTPAHVVPGHDPLVLARYPRHPAAPDDIACLHLAPAAR